MKESIRSHQSMRYQCIEVETLIIGAGAAALSCADHLLKLGYEDFLIVTENIDGGTSANTGSDKQTYYKLSTSSDTPDSPAELARDLFKGGAMHGDIALVEALGSTEAFYRLVNYGVAFPHNSYGGYTGYQTDHDQRQRATSAGPYTSIQMSAALRSSLEKGGAVIQNGIEIVKLVRAGDRIVGAIGIDKSSSFDELKFVVYVADRVVFGTGGPGQIYEKSVYPELHHGGIGLALEIGATAINLTESQYGLASVDFRWNVSGTYQQVLPTYYSIDPDGRRDDFLCRYFPDIKSMLRAIFLKGYQWPFDPRKVEEKGSSLIDILVYIESEVKGNQVYLDFRENPGGCGEENGFSFDDLPDEVYEYLSNSKSLSGKPIDRLANMNPVAIELYRKNGIDLYNEPLAIAVCAQHNNGGLAGDIWWESVNIENFYPVGEVNGSHGVYRPGGSALNSGQVGGIRAAKSIYARKQGSGVSFEGVSEEILEALEEMISIAEDYRKDHAGIPAAEYRKQFQQRMSRNAAHIRSSSIAASTAEAVAQVNEHGRQCAADFNELIMAFQNRHLVIAHLCYLSAIADYIDHDGLSRGSYLILDTEGESLDPLLPEEWRVKTGGAMHMDQVQYSRYEEGNMHHRWEGVREIPKNDFWFENVWKEYRRIYSNGKN